MTRYSRRGRVGTVLIASILMLLLTASIPRAHATILLEFTLPGTPQPEDIFAFDSGTAYFSEVATGSIGVLLGNPPSVFNRLSLPADSISPQPKGIHGFSNSTTKFVVVAENGRDRIGVLKTSTAEIFEYRLPSGRGPLNVHAFRAGGASADNFTIAVTMNSAGRIGLLTSRGGLTEFLTPTGASSKPFGLVADSDGNLWYTDEQTDRVGKLNPQTGAITEYRLPANSRPRGIAIGPDGFLWVAELNFAIARINPYNGIAEEFFLASGAGQPYKIAVNSDGRVWFTTEAHKVGRFDPDTRTFTIFDLPLGTLPHGIFIDTAAQFVWIAETQAQKIGQFRNLSGNLLTSTTTALSTSASSVTTKTISTVTSSVAPLQTTTAPTLTTATTIVTAVGSTSTTFTDTVQVLVTSSTFTSTSTSTLFILTSTTTSATSTQFVSTTTTTSTSSATSTLSSTQTLSSVLGTTTVSGTSTFAAGTTSTTVTSTVQLIVLTQGTFTQTSTLTTTTKVPAAAVCPAALVLDGSELSGNAKYLRAFRDGGILSTSAGREFMKVFNAWYYSWATRVAEEIAPSAELKTAGKLFLYPLVGALHAAASIYSQLTFSPEIAAIASGIVASGMIGLVYVGLPLALIGGIAGRQVFGRSARSCRRLLPLTSLTGASLTLLGFMLVSGELLAVGTSLLVVATFSAVSVSSGSLLSHYVQLPNSLSFLVPLMRKRLV